MRFAVSATIPAAPQEVYDAWLDGRRHAAMTGARATASRKVGGRFTAWDGYASGRNLELAPGKRIVQSWRTTDFGEDEPDSKITVTLTAARTGTRLTLVHSGLGGEGAGYKAGWRDYYLAPMKAYFAARRKR